MPTPIWLTGPVHGWVIQNTGGIWNFRANGAQVTIDTTITRIGPRSLKIAANGVATNIGRDLLSGDYGVLRGYFRFEALPSATVAIGAVSGLAGLDPTILYDQPTGQIRVRFGSSGGSMGGPVIETGRWYLCDFKVLFNAGTKTIDCQIDGQALTQVTLAEAATTLSLVRFGTTGAATYTVYWTDMFLSNLSADYPIGPGTIRGVSPNADGTHSGITAGDFTDEAGTDIVVGTTDAWTNVASVPFQTANRIEQRVTRTGAYVELLFGDIPDTAIWAVQGELGYHAAGTAANSGATYASHDNFGTNTTIYGTAASPADMSESSLFTKYAIITPPGGGWTQADVANLKMRIGHSSDAAPDVYWDGLMFEVAVAEPPAAASLLIPRGPRTRHLLIR